MTAGAARSAASRRGWATRKRMTAVRARDPQAALEQRMAGARQLQGSAPVADTLSTIINRIRVRDGAPPSQGS